MLAAALYQTFDGIFVGQYLGTTAFAAANLAMPFVVINFAVSDLIGVGSSVVISLLLGRGERAEANNAFTCSVLLIVGLGTALGAALFAGAPLIMSLMGATDELAELAVDYLRVYALCSPFTTLFYATDNYMRISGYLKANMALCVLMSAISLVLEVLFLGVLGWGIWAAALACSLAMVICLVFSLAPFVMRRATLAFCHPRFTLDLVKRVFACGSPTFLNNVAQRIASIVINAVLVRLGGEAAVSAYGVLMFVDSFAQPLFYGTCDALQPAVSYNWGARRYGRVRALEKRCFLAAAAIGAAAVAVVALFPDALIALFMPDATGEVLALSRDALGLFTITYLFRWLAFATQSYMNAIAKPLPASLISVSAALVFPLVLLVVLHPLRLTGIWLNFPGTAVLCALLSVAVLAATRAKTHRPDAGARERQPTTTANF